MFVAVRREEDYLPTVMNEPLQAGILPLQINNTNVSSELGYQIDAVDRAFLVRPCCCFIHTVASYRSSRDRRCYNHVS